MDNVFVNLIYVSFPILLYFLLVAHNKIMKRDKSDFLFDFTLVLSLTFVLSFGKNIYIYDIGYIVYIPLLLGYIKRRNVFVILLSIFLILYLSINLGYNVFITILNLISLFLLYKYNKKDYEKYFTIVNIIFLLVLHNFELDYITVIVTYIFTTYVVLFFFNRVDKVMKFYMSLKEIANSKQLQESLFKISHEIKNPIAVCKGYLELMDGSKEKYDKYIPIIHSEINHSLSILKDFSSIGKLKIELDIMDICLLMSDVLNDYEVILKNKKIRLINDNKYDELFIMGDYIRLKEVFINIIKNSIEALEGIDNPFISIYVSLKNDKIIIKIVDNGCGISSEDLAKISEPFFTTKKDGTGLGTYLSKQIMSKHNGSINYSSNGDGMKVELVFDNYVI